jgi:hypothetical protein
VSFSIRISNPARKKKMESDQSSPMQTEQQNHHDDEDNSSNHNSKRKQSKKQANRDRSVNKLSEIFSSVNVDNIREVNWMDECTK